MVLDIVVSLGMIATLLGSIVALVLDVWFPRRWTPRLLLAFAVLGFVAYGTAALMHGQWGDWLLTGMFALSAVMNGTNLSRAMDRAENRRYAKYTRKMEKQEMEARERAAIEDAAADRLVAANEALLKENRNQ